MKHQKLTTFPVPSAARQTHGGLSAGRFLLVAVVAFLVVVEDNQLNQLVAEATLAQLGYAFHSVANGAEALDAFAAMPYAAILMDCHMPVMDGFTATGEIRRRELSGLRTPIIAMTAAASNEDRRRCLEAGMDDYVSKPVEIMALQAVLDRWVRRATESADLQKPEPPSEDFAAELAAPPPVLNRSQLASLTEEREEQSRTDGQEEEENDDSRADAPPARAVVPDDAPGGEPVAMYRGASRLVWTSGGRTARIREVNHVELFRRAGADRPV